VSEQPGTRFHQPFEIYHHKVAASAVVLSKTDVITLCIRFPICTLSYLELYPGDYRYIKSGYGRHADLVFIK